MLALALAGGLYAFTRIRPDFRARTRVEKIVMALLLVASLVAILTTFGIVLSLLFESIRFFRLVPPTELLFGTHWAPTSGAPQDDTFGGIPLFWGTIFIGAIIAMVVAIPGWAQEYWTASLAMSTPREAQSSAARRAAFEHLSARSRGALQARAIGWARRAWPAVVLGMAAISVATPWVSETVRGRWFAMPQLILLLPDGDGLRELQQTVRERGLPMVDMGNNREIAQFGNISHARLLRAMAMSCKSLFPSPLTICHPGLVPGSRLSTNCSQTTGLDAGTSPA